MVACIDRRGLKDWIIQRATAVLIGAYALFVIIYFLIHCPLSYAIVYNLFSNFVMKIATFIVLLSILVHAWIGLWTVLTDYAKNRLLRTLLLIVILLLFIFYAIWMMHILWVTL